MAPCWCWCSTVGEFRFSENSELEFPTDRTRCAADARRFRQRRRAPVRRAAGARGPGPRSTRDGQLRRDPVRFAMFSTVPNSSSNPSCSLQHAVREVLGVRHRPSQAAPPARRQSPSVLVDGVPRRADRVLITFTASVKSLH
jgi:hypothetical protein